ncbi:MAG: M28 family peptidase [Massilia sp.]
MTVKETLQTIGIVIFFIVVTVMSMEENEWSRIYGNAHSGNQQPQGQVDGSVLAADVDAFVSPALASREVGSAGSRQAQSYITARYAQIGLLGFGDTYAWPFSFTRTQIGGLFKPGAHWKQSYPVATNLVGYVRGTHFPQRYIVVSARYDTHAEPGKYGLDQWKANESGLAAMLAMAAYFAQHPPRNSIVFAAFDAEELGQAGARAFVDHPPMAREQIALNLNLDIVTSKNAYEFCIAGTQYTPPLKWIVDAASYSSKRPVGMGHDRPFWRAIRVADWTGESDHRVFHEAGIPFLFASVEESDDEAAARRMPANSILSLYDTANFLTVLALKLDENSEVIPVQRRGVLF